MKTLIAVCALLPLAAQTPPSFREYRVEAAHSSIAFDIPFLGHPVHGRFDDVRGTIVYTPRDLTQSSVTVAIATSSINTGSKHRDEHLRSSDFFDAGNYPTIFFTSRAIRRIPGGLIVSGPLSMHGVTRDVSIPFREVDSALADPHGSSLVFFTGALRLARRDFGIAGGSRFNDWFDELRQRALGDTVNIALEVQGWDTDYDRSEQWKSRVDRLIASGVSARVASLRSLAAQRPDTLRNAEWEIDQTARALLQRGRSSDALELFKLEGDLFPKSATAQAGLARGLEATNDLAGAAAVLDRALAIDPAEPLATEIRKRLDRKRSGS
jgi:polyisoprenoid-binding protein YceI